METIVWRFTTYPFSAFTLDWSRSFNIKGCPTTKGDVVIGNDVWIGYNATILSGVPIGDGTVISACSLVTKNVQPYVVVGGNPSETFFNRFDKKIINLLLEIKWWNFPKEIISDNLEVLCSNNYEKLKELYKTTEELRATGLTS